MMSSKILLVSKSIFSIQREYDFIFKKSFLFNREYHLIFQLQVQFNIITKNPWCKNPGRIYYIPHSTT